MIYSFEDSHMVINTPSQGKTTATPQWKVILTEDNPSGYCRL